MLKENVAQAVLAEALKTGGDFAEIFLEDRLNNGLSMLSGKVETVLSRRLHGAGVRVFNGVQGVYVYTNDTTEAGLIACARRAASAVAARAAAPPSPCCGRIPPRFTSLRKCPIRCRAGARWKK